MRRWNRVRADIWPLAVLIVLGFTSTPASPDEPAAVDENAKQATNRLARETSPYLLQHVNNPVDWYPWGPEAFEAAKAEDKPVFLSIGYSSCYWCHVMERESFEDEDIAKVLNEHFICIKVDREERPDVDQIYMTALQAFSGRGGWPLSMFLTHEGKPFFGGTYFPPTSRDGMPGFPQILDAVNDAWTERREATEQYAENLTQTVRRISEGTVDLERVPLSRDLAAKGLDALAEQFDPDHGGFGYDPDRSHLPKFPEPANLIYLLDQHQRGKGGDGPKAPLAMVETSLDHMARGGLRDHLGGGYHRYSTDRFWEVPHFEKMLYDNAQLAEAHLLAFEVTGDPRWKREAEATFAFVEQVMTGDEGAFYSALDAETDEEEGKYYVWSREEIKAILEDEEDDQIFAQVYGLNAEPNFEDDRYVLLLPKPLSEQAEALGLNEEELEARLAPLRAKLLEARREREMPFLDDKILTAWNGRMIAAYAEGYRVLEDERHLQTAERATDFLLDTHRDSEGRLLRTSREGQARLAGYLEDYAYLVDALLRLHAVTGDEARLEQARDLADQMIASFSDEDGGGFFFTADDHESLLTRPKDPYDGALPSPNAVAIRALVALAEATEDASYLDHAGKALEAFAPVMNRSPGSMVTMMLALEEFLDTRQSLLKPGAFQPGANLDDLEVAASKAVASGEITLAKDEPVAPGEAFDIRLTLTIDDRYHINANPAGAPELIPTVLRLSDDSKATLVQVEYPEAERVTFPGQDEPMPVYEGAVTIAARVQLADNAPAGPSELGFQLRYQACDDRACLAPATLNVPLRVMIEARN